MDGFADSDSVKEIEGEELEEILSKLKDSMKLDVRQAVVWNTLGLMLLKAGCLMVKNFYHVWCFKITNVIPFCDEVLFVYDL